MSATHYDILGVTSAAPDSVIRAAFRARMRTEHPDVGGDPVAAARITEAFDTLSDPVRRAAYDADIRGATAPPFDQQPDATQSSERPHPESFSAQGEPEVPHAIWGSVPPPKRWYRSHLASLLLGCSVVGFAGCAALAQMSGAELAMYPVLAASTVTLSSIWLRPRTAAIIAGILGVGVVLLQGLAPAAGVLTIVLVAGVLWLRWRETRAWEAHAVDVVRTTSDAFGLPIEFVRRVEPQGPQTVLVQLEIVGSGGIRTVRLWGSVRPDVVIVRDDMTVLCVAQARAFGYR